MSESGPQQMPPNLRPNLPNRAQPENLADNLETHKPAQKPSPTITTPLPEKFTYVGRGVGRDRTFFEVIELLTFTHKEGAFPHGTTDRMRNTTNEGIQNTSQQGSDQSPSEQPTHKKPTDSEQKTDHGAEKSSQSFTLLDLRCLTFTLDGEQVLNAQDATQ